MLFRVSSVAYWLMSLLAHAGLLAWVATLGGQPDKPSDPDKQCSLSATAQIMLEDETPAEPPSRVAEEPLAVLLPKAASESLPPAWPVFGDEQPPENTVHNLEDIAGSPQGDGAAAQGTGRDASAGSLDTLETLETTGPTAEEWSRLCPKTIGVGRPGSERGTGTQAAASGQGGSGQGSGGIAGAGYGKGTAGASGSGPAGAGAAPGAAKTSVGVEPLFMGSGEYPERARREKREGVVRLKVEVLADGKAGAVEVAKTSGSEDLDQAAVKAARKWRFKPPQRDGHAIPVWVEVPVRYQLQDGG